ncbi:hypothetical protein A6U87_09350 [Rhizobium sp. AC44/96]|nr:hypothetical protein A6U87_09350 [Rhizobium sp. AC44/96]
MEEQEAGWNRPSRKSALPPPRAVLSHEVGVRYLPSIDRDGLGDIDALTGNCRYRLDEGTKVARAKTRTQVASFNPLGNRIGLWRATNTMSPT